MATYSGSSLENSKDRGAWRTTVHGAAESPQVTVHGVTESRTQLNNWTHTVDHTCNSMGQVQRGLNLFAETGKMCSGNNSWWEKEEGRCADNKWRILPVGSFHWASVAGAGCCYACSYGSLCVGSSWSSLVCISILIAQKKKNKIFF